MIEPWPIVSIARVTLEVVSVLSIGSGVPTRSRDSPVVTDANGLPAIPGTSIAGVLRRLHEVSYGHDRTDAVFGNADRPSRIEVSWAHIHDANNVPVDGLNDDGPGDGLQAREARLRGDPILAGFFAASAPIRDRVRISRRGASEHGGKFDRDVVSRGHRFTFDLALWQEALDSSEWNGLLSLLRHGRFRLGGATRIGLGRCEVKWVFGAEFDLRRDLERFAALARRLDQGDGFRDITDSIAAPSATELTARVDLRPCGFWRIGTRRGTEKVRQGSRADRSPLLERCVRWPKAPGSAATLSDRRLVVPAAGIKGALRHRTAFHLRRLRGDLIDDAGPPEALDRLADGAETELAQLFGEAKRRRDAAGTRAGEQAGEGGAEAKPSGGTRRPQAGAGALIPEDVYLEADNVTLADPDLWNVGIDRFIGGAHSGRLIQSETPFGGSLIFCFTLRQARPIDARVLQAFGLALRDLCVGRLAVGAESRSGHGYCLAPAGVVWSDAARWKELLVCGR